MSLAAKKTVELFYDVVSPYSWIAFEVLTRYQTKWNIDLKLKPFFLGGIMKGSENRPPASVPNKAVYMPVDLKRLANHFHIPINQPANPAEVMFIKGTLQTQRFITAIDMQDPTATEKLSREMWMRIWSRDEDAFEPENLLKAGQTVGLSDTILKDALVKMKSPEVKARVAEYTQQALDTKAFGAPWIIANVNGEKHCFWGADRFHVLADCLGEKYEGPLTSLAKAKL